LRKIHNLSLSTLFFIVKGNNLHLGFDVLRFYLYCLPYQEVPKLMKRLIAPLLTASSIFVLGMSLVAFAGETKGSKSSGGTHSSPPGKSSPKEHPSKGSPTKSPGAHASPPGHGGEGN